MKKVAALMAALWFATGLNGSALPQDIERTQTRPMSTLSLDDVLLKIAAKLPGFGGMFVDNEGVLNVYMLPPEAPLSGEGKRALEVRIQEAVMAVLGDRLAGRVKGLPSAPQPVGEPRRMPDVVILTADYDVRQLSEWREKARPLLDTPGVAFLDLDEARNRLRVGITSSVRPESIHDVLNRLGIPTKAVEIEITELYKFYGTLKGKSRPVQGGCQIEADTGWFSYNRCTMAFNAIRGGKPGFVTNSHCTMMQGGTEGTDFHQPDDPWWTEGNKIGHEATDPQYFSGGACPAGRRCRYSDSAFIGYTIPRGSAIAQTTSRDGSTSVNPDASTLQIRSVTTSPLGGEILDKVGWRTGWTYGQVNGTCLDIQVRDTDITLLCQDRALRTSGQHKIADHGDSGSPVFRRLGGDDVSVYGVLWGGPDDGSTFSFSPMEGVEQELGALTVASLPAVAVRLLPFDYSPIDGSEYALNWPGPPRRELRWEDVKIYRPSVRLDNPAPAEIAFSFWVKEDRSWWFDKTLGLVRVTFRQGEMLPSDADIIGPSASGSGKAPFDAPSHATGGFYLGCTKKGKVKGSEDKNGREATVYMERFSVASTGGVPVDWYSESDQSPRHKIRCK